ncbi:MAG: hypothetical protein ACK4ND_00965 [Cytophagaceae bacterium]
MKNYLILFILPFVFFSCGTNPEQLIVGEWIEVCWEYEDYSRIKFKEHDHRKIIKHETEKWVFTKDRFEVKKANGRTMSGKWLLSGRGNILKLIYDDDNKMELYDIKELNRSDLILNVNIGMEIKGIGNLHLKSPKPL